MRDILFRGQTRRLGEKVRMNGEKVPSNWVYGGVCQGNGSFSIIYGSMDVELEAPTEKHVVYTDTVGQYTGLTDKNGVKIFEGDIVLCGLIPCVIKWDTVNARFMFYENGEYIRNGFNIDTMKLKEVIGNVYDNPELLEATTEV